MSVLSKQVIVALLLTLVLVFCVVPQFLEGDYLQYILGSISRTENELTWREEMDSAWGRNRTYCDWLKAIIWGLKSVGDYSW